MHATLKQKVASYNIIVNSRQQQL